jgi:peptidoglycan/xylan/chitin deacetylase (PgdA/CDA1 family)
METGLAEGFADMGSSVKRVVLQTLRATGAFAASTHLLRRNKLVILCYHGISLRDEHLWEGGLYMPADLFRERLAFLKRWGANVLPLGAALRHLREGTLPPKSVVITFDDGFYDFYLHAYPALREYNLPSTLYLTTWYTRHRLPVFPLMIKYLLWKSGQPEFATNEAREQAVARYSEQADAEGLSPELRDNIARRLAEKVGVDYDGMLKDRMFQLVTPEEATEMSRNGVDIELHTHRHRTPHDRELFLREIRDNAKLVMELTGHEPKHFCYPSGVTSSEFLPWLRESGMASATTCDQGLAGRDNDPLLLPRYLDGCAVSELDFESWLSGIR